MSEPEQRLLVHLSGEAEYPRTPREHAPVYAINTRPRAARRREPAHGKRTRVPENTHPCTLR